MATKKTDASIAFSATDNLSESIKGMKNSVNSFKQDAVGLQKQLNLLDQTRFQLKNIDLKRAQQELQRTRKAFNELGESATQAEREAAEADFRQATQNYENIRRQLNLVSKQARETEKDLIDVETTASRQNNRAGDSSGSSQSLVTALGKAGLGQMAGDAAQQIADTLIGSALGEAGGTIASSGLSGAISGAAIGSMIAPGIGTAVGALAGGVLGAAQGAAQVYESQDEAFKSYYQSLYEEGLTARQESLSAGIATASQRELDAIAFDRLLGEGVGTEYLSDLRRLAADTPLEYSDLTQMSRALATGFGDSPERMLELMQAIGDAGSAVGVTASDMTTMAQAMSRMQSSGKATLEYLNILQERGVDVIGMLAEEYGKTQGEIYDMISKSEINGRDAVSIIQAGMTESYSGAMDRMSETFSGLTSTLEDTMTEIDNARGEGYNTIRSQGLEAEIGAYGGALGDAMQALNRISGQNEAFLENLSEQYTREALSAVLLGEDTTLFGREQQQELRGMRAQYALAEQQYAEGREEAGLEMESLARQAEALAQTAYESSEEYAMMRETELDLIGAIRENTAALDSWKYDFEQSQEFSKGRASVSGIAQSLWSGPAVSPQSEAAARALVGDGGIGYADIRSGGTPDTLRDSLVSQYPGHASGLRRVPYDGYAAILHMGERVLTAREAREQDRAAAGGGISINISGQWTVRSDDDVDRVAEAIVRKVELAQRAGVR